MADFEGFPADKVPATPLPNAFFSELLANIEDIAELKLLLFVFWRLAHQERRFPFVTKQELTADAHNMNLAGPDPTAALEALNRALDRCTSRRSLLAHNLESDGNTETLYLLNSVQGRAASAALQSGEWVPTSGAGYATKDFPNIFRLYEENFGPLTPMIAEALEDADSTFPLAWIEEAMRIAVENNVRRWRYVEAILNSWQEKGKHEGQSGKGTQEDRHRYIRGEFSEFVER